MENKQTVCSIRFSVKRRINLSVNLLFYDKLFIICGFLLLRFSNAAMFRVQLEKVPAVSSGTL
jgi:hypothetical protein